MRKRIPSKTVEVCDVCERQSSVGFLVKCEACGKDYCHTCEGIISGCVHQPEVCRECASRDEVTAVIAKFVRPLRATLNQRDKELRKLRKPAAAVARNGADGRITDEGAR